MKNVYDVDSFSYGVELEYGNCLVGTKLPDGAAWNDKDNTCVSSTGIANDPFGIMYKYGGEINTKPTMTIDEQISHIAYINASLDRKIVNYRSNLHIHVRVPDLHNNLEACKNLLRYVNTYQQVAFDIVETIPTASPNANKHAFDWEVKRQKRRMKSHQYKLPKSRVDAMLLAENTNDFYLEHAPLTEKGRMWFFSPRAGINLRQMWEETNTIEFRHFPGTLDMEEMESCVRWCKEFLSTALSGEDKSPAEIEGKFKFPKFQPYEYETEQCYQHTNVDGNTKTEVKEILKKLRENIDIDDIDNTNSKDVLSEIYKLGYKQK